MAKFQLFNLMEISLVTSKMSGLCHEIAIRIQNASVNINHVMLWSEFGKLIILITILQHFYKG